MPANIDSMMYVGEVPWHGLGTKLDKPATAAEAMAAAKLDWTVGTEPLFLGNGDKVRDHVGIVRSDTRAVLGVAGNRFVPLQNSEAFAAFDAVVGSGQAIYHTAGSLGIGERVWLLAKLPGDIVVKGVDMTEKYMLLANGHDGGLSVKVGASPVRVVCANTLALALGAKDNFVSVRHTGDVKGRTEEAFRILGVVNQKYDELAKFFNALAAKPLFGENLGKVVADIFPAAADGEVSTRLKNIRSTVMNRIENGKGSDLPGIGGTAWAAFNGVTEYLDHFRVMKGDKDSEATRSRRLDNIWFGTVAQVRERAAKVIAEAVGVGI